jgi:hypothetical protein
VEAEEQDRGFELEVTRFTPAPATDTLPVPTLANLDGAGVTAAVPGAIPGRPGLAIGCRRGSGPKGQDEPHPTLMRTPAALA